MNRGWIEKQWQGFATKIRIDGPETPEVQRVEMRRAFFAGASLIFQLVGDMADGTTEPTEENLQLMTDINDEISAFVRDLTAGRA